jgi:hypothetical protein
MSNTADAKVAHAVPDQTRNCTTRLTYVPGTRGMPTLHPRSHMVLLCDVAEDGIAKLGPRAERGQDAQW